MSREPPVRNSHNCDRSPGMFPQIFEDGFFQLVFALQTVHLDTPFLWTDARGAARLVPNPFVVHNHGMTRGLASSARREPDVVGECPPTPHHHPITEQR